MSGKKINIRPRPSSQARAQAEAWVENRGQEENQVVQMKRLTVDIPDELHRKMKADCAMQGLKIADVIREMLMERFGR